MQILPKTLTIVSLFFLAACNTPHSQGKVVEQSRPRLSATEEFDLRGKCAELGDKMVEGAYGIVGVALTSEMTTHYSPESNRCYVEFTVTKNLSFNYPSTPTNYRTETIYDGQTKQLLVFASQEGDKRYGLMWTVSSGMGSATYEQAEAEINRLMGGNVQ